MLTEKQINTLPDSAARPPFADNIAIAEKLRDYADLLYSRGDDDFRSRAYRNASDVVASLTRPVTAILTEEGRGGLEALPAIGDTIAGAIAQMVSTGRWQQLERLRKELTPEVMFRSIPGIGKRLAATLAKDEHLATLEDLENAIAFGGHDIKGIGPRRSRMIAAVLASRLGKPLLASMKEPSRPPDALLLEVDRIYRQRAAAGQLRRIAPRRFNPSHEAWLPVMRMNHDDWHFTALFSNTKRAHEVGKTGDWVVIYHQRDGEPEARSTVISAGRGAAAGQRVIRRGANAARNDGRRQRSRSL